MPTNLPEPLTSDDSPAALAYRKRVQAACQALFEECLSMQLGNRMLADTAATFFVNVMVSGVEAEVWTPTDAYSTLDKIRARLTARFTN